MPNLEWTVPHTLQTSLGDLDLNVPDMVTGREYLLLPAYSIVPTLRVTQDNLSQADGAALHPRWKTGLVASLVVKYIIRTGGDAKDYEPACGQDLREMHDELMRLLNSIRSQDLFPDLGSAFLPVQRFLWTPSGYSGGNRRMLDDVQLLSWPTPDRPENEDEVSFALETPFPYAIDLTQHQTDIAAGGSATLSNVGSSEFKPVIHAHGPTSGFTITNATTGKVFTYDAGRPGASSIAGGHYAEIDFFKGTVTLDGDVVFLDEGIDPTVTDFWELVADDNHIGVSGADISILWNDSWS